MAKTHRARRLTPGTAVVCTTGKLRGTDPFTELVVTEVHSDGTVDLAKLGGGKSEWTRVDPAELTVVR